MLLAGMHWHSRAPNTPLAMPLSSETNVSYCKTNAANDYWALSPYYLPQISGRSCSAANIAMVLNAARSKQPLTSDDKLVTTDSLIREYAPERYKKSMLGTFDRSAVSNEYMAEVIRVAAEKLGIKTDTSLIEVKNLDMNLQASKNVLQSTEGK